MFCRHCGKEIDDQAVICVGCGCEVRKLTAAPVSQKSKLIAGLLGIFLGGYGIHNFYLGYTKKALVQLIITLVGFFISLGTIGLAIWIWGLVEGIMILAGGIKTDGKGNPFKD